MNPGEGIWKLAKGMLTNGCPKDRRELSVAITKALRAIAKNRKNLRACVNHFGLPFRLF